MEYVNLDAEVGNLSGALDPARYLKHPPPISGDLPPRVRFFATDAGHYHFDSRRCVKDLTPSCCPGRRMRGDGGHASSVTAGSTPMGCTWAERW